MKTGPQGHIYLPKKIREAFGDRLNFLPNTNAAVIYPENVKLDSVVRSVEILLADLKLRAEGDCKTVIA